MKFSHLLIITFSFLFSSYSHSALPENASSTILKHFSENEKKKLQLFFEETIFNDSFGYTIFGNKPVSLAGYFTSPQYMAPTRLKQNHIALFSGETLCRKCNTFLEKSNFFFKIQHEYKPEIDWTVIYIINKKAFFNIVEKNITYFKSILGENITAEKLLSNIINPDNTVEETLQYHEGLKGIILGYGVSNSMYYHRKAELEKAIALQYAPPLLVHDKKIMNISPNISINRAEKNALVRILPMNKYKSLSEEYRDIRTLLSGCGGSYELLYPFSLPVFRGNPDDDETKELLIEYETTRKKMIQKYKNNNFLEVTVCGLLSD